MDLPTTGKHQWYLMDEGSISNGYRNTDLLIAILSSLPSTSNTRSYLTNELIDGLWSDLQHPPLS